MLISPIITVACFYGIGIYNAVTLKEPSLNHNNSSRSKSVAACLAAIVICYLFNFALCISKTVQTSNEAPEAAEIVQHLSSIVLYARFCWTFLQDHNVIWYQYGGAWASTLAFHLLEMSVTPQERSRLPTAIVGLFIIAISLASRYQVSQVREAQSQSHRMQRELRRKQKEELDQDLDSDSEYSDSATDKQHLEQRKKRLQEAGNWLEYIKPYKIFLPMIFPVNNIRLQACMLLLLCDIVIGRLFGLMVPRYMGIITDKLIADSANGTFPWSDIAIWGVLSLFESELFYNIKSLLYLPLQQFASRELSLASFKHVMDLSMDFHHDKSSSDLIRVVEQGSAITELLQFACFDIMPLLADTIIALIYMATVFDAYMLLIVVSGAACYLWFKAQRSKWVVDTRKAYNQAARESSKVQYEALSNWSTVSQFNRNGYEITRYSDHLNRFIKAEKDMSRSRNLSDLPILTISRIAATALAMYRVSQGTIPLGELITFMAVYSTVVGPITAISWMTRRMQSLLTDSERLLLLLQTKRSIVEPPGAKKLRLKNGKIEFDHVDFAYDPRKKTLSDVSFTAKPGATVALVGETGGGKSTILKMLYRYYDVNSGSIKIDGQDIREVKLDSLRDLFGFVPQNPSLFNTTILENLRYARLDATDEDIVVACKAACIHEKIMQFPDKYESKVGERGIKLSGGEMQRVAIARAILRDPKIVLLDEATSQIDALTEGHIQTALTRLTAGRTTFVVAHRLSTIQHADLIIVIEDGRIVEKGSHDELWKLNGKYVALWSRQLNKGFAESTEKSNVSTPMTSSDDDHDGDTESDEEKFI